MLNVIIWFIAIAVILWLIVIGTGFVIELFSSSDIDKKSPYHPDNRDSL